jgi:hypothetical protein
MTDWNEAHAILCKEHAELTAKYSLLLVRSEVEQRVLDACAEAEIVEAYEDPCFTMGSDEAIARAELARRGLKP